MQEKSYNAEIVLKAVGEYRNIFVGVTFVDKVNRASFFFLLMEKKMQILSRAVCACVCLCVLSPPSIGSTAVGVQTHQVKEKDQKRTNAQMKRNYLAFVYCLVAYHLS